MKRVITTNYEAVEEDDRRLNVDRLCTSFTEEDRTVSWKSEDVHNNDKDGHNVECKMTLFRASLVAQW